MEYLNLQTVSKRFNLNRNGFTLVELAITMGVILVLSTIGLFLYQSALAYARGTVCETNVKALKNAVEAYSFENDALPATLGQLKLEHVEKGYARALQENRWKVKFSQFMMKLEESDYAYAQFLTPENLKKYGVAEKVFLCPADGDGSPSYGINAAVQGKKWADINPNEIIVADSNHYVFTLPVGLAKRHHDKANAVTKDGQIVKVADAADVDPDDTGDDEVTLCHKPGGPEEKTITIPNSALSAHLGHGDTTGACASGK